MSFLVSRCRTWIAVGVLAGVLMACGSEDPNAVASLRGWSLDAETLESEFERVNPDVPWMSTTVEQRAGFAELLLKKEVLVRIADEACPDPDVKRARLGRVLYEKNLMREFLQDRRERFSMPQDLLEVEVSKLNRKARVYLSTVRKQDLDAVRQAMFDGGTFEEVAKRFATDAGPHGRGYAEATIGLDNISRPVLRAVFLDDVPEGTVVGPVSTTKGNFFLQVIEYTPWVLEQVPGALDRAYRIVNDVYYQPFNQAYVESLTTASGIHLHEESFPVVKEVMQTFWDSINTAQMSGESVQYQEFQAPTWLVSDEQAEVPVLDLFGKTYGVRDFIGTLDAVDLDYWVTIGNQNKIDFQIETRAQRLLQTMEAEKTGVPERPTFQALMKKITEQHLLDQYRDRHLAKQFAPTEEELQAEYRANPDLYISEDKIAWGLLMFAPAREARAREVREILRNADPVRWFELAAAEAEGDDLINYYADTGLKGLQEAPPDPSWEPFRQAAVGLEQGALSEVMRTQHGFTIVRCNQRVLPTRMTFEEAREDIEANLLEAWLDAEIERRLTEGMDRFGAKVDTAKLEADKLAESGAAAG